MTEAMANGHEISNLECRDNWDFVKTVVTKLPKQKLHLVGVQKVGLGKGHTDSVNDYTFSVEMGMRIMLSCT
jgi:hypothetical protein